MEVEYDAVLKYLQLKQYPEGSTPKNKRSIGRKSENFVLRDGLLFHSSGGVLRQWISSKEKQKQIMTYTSHPLPSRKYNVLTKKSGNHIKINSMIDNNNSITKMIHIY